MSRRTAALLFTLIGLGYVGTRLVLLWRFPPFVDEATFAWWTLEGYEIPDRRLLAISNGREPMQPWLAMGFMDLGASPLTAVRLVSLAAGGATLALAAALAHRVAGTAVAVAAAGLYVVLPFTFVHDVVGIMDPLVAALAAAALYLQLRLAERPRLDLALLLGLVFAVGVLTKPTSHFAIALAPLSLLCFDWSAARRASRLAQWAGALALAGAMAWVAQQLLKLNPAYYRADEIRLSIGQYRTLRESLRDPLRYLGENLPGLLDAYLGYVTAPLLLAAAAGAVALFRSRPRLTAVMTAWIVVPLAGAALLGAAPFPRYLLPTIAPLLVLTAFGAGAAWSRARQLAAVRRVPPELAATGAAALVLLPALLLNARIAADPDRAEYPARDDFQYATGFPAGGAWKAVVRELRRRAAGDRALVAIGSRQDEALRLLLRDAPHIELIGENDPRAPFADYAIENWTPLTLGDDELGLLAVWVYARPRGGKPLTLYAQGPVVHGEVQPTPERLREALGLRDAAFDAYLTTRPRIAAWYEDWYDRRVSD